MVLFDNKDISLGNGSDCATIVSRYVDSCKLGEDALVEWQADSIMLLDGCIEQTLHHTMVTHTLDDVALKAMLGRDTCWHEPLFKLKRV